MVEYTWLQMHRMGGYQGLGYRCWIAFTVGNVELGMRNWELEIGNWKLGQDSLPTTHHPLPITHYHPYQTLDESDLMC